jgi:hypothetical protein
MLDAESPAAVVRDVRVDRIGFVNELVKNYADALKTGVKVAMLDKSAERAAGDYFDALLVQGSTRTIDPKDLYKLLKSGAINEKQFCSAVTVKLDACGEFLSRDQIARLADERPSSPQLRITRKKGVSIGLVEAIKAVSDAIAAAAPLPQT